jgi:plastocyanin
MLKLSQRDHRVAAVLALTLFVLAFSSVAALASSPNPVKVRDGSFSTKKLTVSKGTRIKWTWTGFLQHNVSVQRGPTKFHSPTQVRGTWSSAFRHRGTYHMYCTIHPFMQMTIVVK